MGRLVDQGNSVLVIEHNLDVIKTADWVVDFGPEGGSGGGRIMAQGTPEDVARARGSFTGQFLREVLRIEGPVEPPSDRELAITPESLKALRLSLGLSQAEAAHAVGVSRGLVAEAERGRRTGERTLARIALGLRALAEKVAT